MRKILTILLVTFIFFSSETMLAEDTDNHHSFDEIEKINALIEKYDLNWSASVTSRSFSPITPSCFFTEEIDVNQTFISSNIVMYDEFDWRNYNGFDWTTSIKDQKSCGSCWAFGTLAALESCLKIWTNNPIQDIDLSEQYMISCSPGDCDGWYEMQTLHWLKSNGAISESCFRYRASDRYPCEHKCDDWRDELVGISDYKRVSGSGSTKINAIQDALVNYGPLPAGMKVYDSFYHYNHGIYEPLPSDDFSGNHLISIVGFKNTGAGNGYWICKNSWGEDWGETNFYDPQNSGGWFKIAYNTCNIEDRVYLYEGINHPPEITKILSGITEGRAGQSYSYSVKVKDDDGDRVKYCFEWGDGNESWSDYVEQDKQLTSEYSWEKGKRGEENQYTLRVKAVDEIGLAGEWSDPLIIVMKTPWIENHKMTLFERIMTFFPFLGFLNR
jgi:C1A family cysteine protease